jgi:hypothetical protein
MQFLKKHYEKILLGVVLAGMVAVLVFMIFYIASETERLRQKTEGLIKTPAKELPSLDATTNDAAMARVQSPYVLDLETGNKVFNPQEWQKKADGTMLIKPGNIAQFAVVTNITSLYLVLTLDSVMTNDLGARYVIGVEKQAEKVAAKRHKQQRYVSAGEKANDTFALVDIKGAPEDPDSITVRLVDSGETVSITRSQPYRRVDGYTADFRYDLEKKVFLHRRAGDKVSFGGTDYVVADINANEVILSDQSNQKKTPLPFAP